MNAALRPSTIIILNAVGVAHILVGILASLTGSDIYDNWVGDLAIAAGVAIVIAANTHRVTLGSLIAVFGITALSTIQALAEPLGVPLVGFFLSILLARMLLGRFACVSATAVAIASYIGIITIDRAQIKDLGSVLVVIAFMFIAALVLVVQIPIEGGPIGMETSIGLAEMVQPAAQAIMQVVRHGSAPVEARQKKTWVTLITSIHLIESIIAVGAVFAVYSLQHQTSFPLLPLIGICLLSFGGSCVGLLFNYTGKSRLATAVFLSCIIVAQECSTPFLGGYSTSFLIWPVVAAIMLLDGWLVWAIASLCTLMGVANIWLEAIGAYQSTLPVLAAKILGVVGSLLAGIPVILIVVLALIMVRQVFSTPGR